MGEIERKAVAALISSGLPEERATVVFQKAVEGYRRGETLPDEVREVLRPILDGSWVRY